MTHSNDFVSVYALHRDIKAHSNIKIVIAWLKEIIHEFFINYLSALNKT